MLLFISKLFFKEGIINKLIEMNSLIIICPNCKKHMKYALDKQFIKINCKCEFSSGGKVVATGSSDGSIDWNTLLFQMNTRYNIYNML